MLLLERVPTGVAEVESHVFLQEHDVDRRRQRRIGLDGKEARLLVSVSGRDYRVVIAEIIEER
jgi:hypothetical protein